MVKDILAILISGAGVERLFSIARSVCDIRRASLVPETIISIMILKYHNSNTKLQEEEDLETSQVESKDELNSTIL